MKRSSFQRYSLKTRVILFTLVMILLSIWSLTFYADRMLRQDIQHLLGTQQLATVSLMATEVNDELSSRQQALERVATQITPAMLRHPEPLQRKLESLVVLQGLFSGGVYVTGREGRALASVPVSQGMTGVNYADRDYISETLQQERPTVGRPTIGRRLKVPIVGMATPVRSPQGEVIGVLAGVINLNVPNFLDRIDLNSRHLPGNYFLVATQQRMIVASNDKSRLMEVLPAAQANPKLDRFIRGYEGTEVLVNPHGVEVLASVRHIPVAGWYAAVTLPTQEAFAPIRRLEHNMLVASVLLTLLVGGLSWWMVRRQLAPLQTTAKMLAQLADPQQPLHPLPEGRADEIGLLIGGFNRLLNELSRRQSGLQESEERYRNLTERSPDPIVVYQGETIIYANPVTVKMLGVESAEDVVGQPFVAFVHPDDRARVTETVLQGAPLGESTPLSEVRVLKADGSTMDMEIHRTSIRFDGQPAGYVAIRDISERKHVEAALRESEALYRTAFSTSPDAFTITRLPDGKYLEVNEGFTRMFGWSRDEVIGKTPAELGIWHDPADRLALLQAVNDKGHCEHFETRFNCKDGNTITVLVSTNAITLNGTPCILSVTHDISARKAALKQIQQLAFSDPLTGLPNRRFFMDRMRQALAASTRHGQYGALLFVDLDDFKSLNDTLGHDQGDLLLQWVAQRISGCVREDDTLARLGGDEFVVLLEHLTPNAETAAEQAEAVGRKILAAVSEPSQFESFEHHGSASIGIALFIDQHATQADLLKQADLAMYQAKAAGRNSLRLFDPQMQAMISERVALATRMRIALDQQQFLLYYQAQVKADGYINGVEALLRWQDPEHGMVSPSKFIPLAEDTGFILPLGRWVLETACQQLAQWARQPALAHLTLAVNVSASQFHQKEFVPQVLDALTRSGAPAQRLKLELTESLLVADVEGVIQKMNELKTHGVGFSIDDFGTGFSSLSYLKRLPIDQLKIDQSFVRDLLTDPNDLAIAKMVVALSRSLGLAVIAEGVETEDQRSALAQLGCHNYQGYLFSRPVPVADFEAVLRNGPPTDHA